MWNSRAEVPRSILTANTAEFRSLVDSGIQLYNPDNLGRHRCVSRVAHVDTTRLIPINKNLMVIQSIFTGISEVCVPIICRNLPYVLTGGSGGPAGAVYGFIFVWIGVASTFVVLSELASMWEILPKKAI